MRNNEVLDDGFNDVDNRKKLGNLERNLWIGRIGILGISFFQLLGIFNYFLVNSSIGPYWFKLFFAITFLT